MKKLLALLSVCVMCLTFTACEPIWSEYEYSDLQDTVADIEIINYDNPKSRPVSYILAKSRNPNFKFNKMTLIETLNEEDCKSFLEDISDKTIGDFVRRYNSPNGVCFKVNYKNGDFDIISEKYIGRFSSTGKFLKYIGVFASDSSDPSYNGKEMFEYLVNTYIETI